MMLIPVLPASLVLVMLAIQYQYTLSFLLSTSIHTSAIRSHATKPHISSSTTTSTFVPDRNSILFMTSTSATTTAATLSVAVTGKEANAATLIRKLRDASDDDGTHSLFGLYRNSQRSSSSGNGCRTIYDLSINTATADTISHSDEQVMTAKLIHHTNRNVPRSFMPSLLVLSSSSSSPSISVYTTDVIYALISESMKWYLDNGGRMNKLQLTTNDKAIHEALSSMSFKPIVTVETVVAADDQTHIHALYEEANVPKDSVAYASNANDLLHFFNQYISKHKQTIDRSDDDSSSIVDMHALYDIVGRLSHDVGNYKASISAYTNALLLHANSSIVFRNMGSAYHSVDEVQLAFASYQQACQLDPADAIVYLKLALFYEQYQGKDWVDAGVYSIKCYNYYLDNVDDEDTSILTRLGNLYVKEHMYSNAIETYNKALLIDNTLHNVHFNKAVAQVKVADISGAVTSLTRTLDLNPSITAAKHMLLSLVDENAIDAQGSDEQYIKDLFNNYASIYDNHGKKLMYSAPRVIRQELGNVYKSRKNSSIGSTTTTDAATATTATTISGGMSEVSNFVEASVPVAGGCSTYASSVVNGTMDILDLGCGTGLAGAWLKDYARTLVGVDISEQMILVAKKKLLYQELHISTISAYLSTCTSDFDIIVAADVLSYIGDLSPTFKQVASRMRSKGTFAFTVESITSTSSSSIMPERGYRLLQTGRFGYTKAYVDRCIAAHMGSGYSVLLDREFSPRLDAGEPVPGLLYIVQKD